MVNVLFSKIAIENLHKLSEYYKDYPGKFNAIKEKIDRGVNTLITFPLAGQIEILTSHLPNPCRSLVIDKDFKLIYDIVEETIIILSIWDCRQDPLKLFDVLQ